jgi:hypothetical protein
MSAPEWQQSSFSSGDGSTNCVELAMTADAVCLRESDDPATVLIAHPARMAALLSHIRATHLDAPR